MYIYIYLSISLSLSLSIRYYISFIPAYITVYCRILLYILYKYMDTSPPMTYLGLFSIANSIYIYIYTQYLTMAVLNFVVLASLPSGKQA